MLLHGVKAPLEPRIVISGIFILNIVLILLVNRVISEVRVYRPFIFALEVVLFGGEPHEALPVHIYPQRVVAGDHHVDPQVELVSEQQQGVVDVARDHTCLVLRHELGLVDNKNTFPLRGCLRFYDPHIALGDLLNAHGPSLVPIKFHFNLLVCLLELLVLIWHHKRFRYEIEISFAEFLLHLFDINSQTIFPGQLIT